MTKSNQQINKEAVVSDTESTPAVVAYRVSQLENTQKEGFKALNEKLDGYVKGFVSEKEYGEAKQEAKDEHHRLQAQLDDMKKNTKWWLTFIFAAMGGIASIILAVKK